MRIRLNIQADGEVSVRGVVTRRGHKQPQKAQDVGKFDLTTIEGVKALSEALTAALSNAEDRSIT